MRIGIFTDGYLPGITGVSTSVDSTVKELERRGHTVVLVAPKYPRHHDNRPVIRIRSVALPNLKNIRIATYLPGTSIALATQIDVDIIHGHAGGPITMLGWEIAKIKRIPFVVTYHTLFNQYTHYVFKGKVIRPKMTEMATRIFANTADYIVAPTQKVNDELVRYGVKKPIKTIPTGIDLTSFHPRPGNNYISDKLGVDRDVQILLYVGRLGKEKSVDYLIKSFAHVAKERKDVILVIAGDGPERHRLESLAKKLRLGNKVHFTGFIDPQDTPLLYSSADVFVFCSRTETQGLVVFEAMASGITPVVVDDPAYRNIIEHEQNGLVAKRGIKGFAREVLRVLSDDKLKMQLAAGALASADQFSLQRSIDTLEQLYKELIAKNS